MIVGYGPDIDPAAAGLGVLAFTTLAISQGSHNRVVAHLRTIPEILEIHTVTGSGDLLVRIVARSNDHLHLVLQRVVSSPDVNRTETQLALSSTVLRTLADLVRADLGACTAALRCQSAMPNTARKRSNCSTDGRNGS